MFAVTVGFAAWAGLFAAAAGVAAEFAVVAVEAILAGGFAAVDAVAPFFFDAALDDDVEVAGEAVFVIRTVGDAFGDFAFAEFFLALLTADDNGVLSSSSSLVIPARDAAAPPAPLFTPIVESEPLDFAADVAAAAEICSFFEAAAAGDVVVGVVEAGAGVVVVDSAGSDFIGTDTGATPPAVAEVLMDGGFCAKAGRCAVAAGAVVLPASPGETTAPVGVATGTLAAGATAAAAIGAVAVVVASGPAVLATSGLDAGDAVAAAGCPPAGSALTTFAFGVVCIQGIHNEDQKKYPTWST
ncbi:hypothetical protein FI667_g1534, partial [Globisporangium splendens]